MTTKKNGYISIENALAMLHPIGSCLILSDTTDPNTLFDGTVWELIGQDKCIIGAGNKFTVMQNIPAGLPNITGTIDCLNRKDAGLFCSINSTYSGAFRGSNPSRTRGGGQSVPNNPATLNFNASLSNSIYGASDTVQPPSIALFIWRRTA